LNRSTAASIEAREAGRLSIKVSMKRMKLRELISTASPPPPCPKIHIPLVPRPDC
jgi:hypothetical protein